MKKTYVLPTANLYAFCKDDIMSASDDLAYEESGAGNKTNYNKW